MVEGKKLAARLVLEKGDPRSATPANEALGRELFDGETVSILRFDDAAIVAEVGGGTRRTVEFRAAGDSLSWRCTCKKGQKRFCKHAFAAALAAERVAAERKLER
jgi:uncharacterized Zn finger protein